MAVELVTDPQYGPSRCRHCARPIVWALTDAGARMPVDPAPVAGGELELFAEYFTSGDPLDEPPVQRVRHRPSEQPSPSPAWRNHWLTCSAVGSRTPAPPREVLEFILRAADRKWGRIGRFYALASMFSASGARS